MSPMNRVARRELPLLILFCSFSARLFAAPLITYPLGVSTGANRLLDVSSGSTQFWLTSGLSGTEPMSAEAGKGTPGSDLTSSAGTAGVHNGLQSGDGSVGSAGGFASETQGTSQTADTGWAGQVTIHPDGSWVGTAKGHTGRVDPADGAFQSRMRAADPAETNRASAGQVSSSASGSGASQPAGAAADATSGSRFPSNTQGKGATDAIAPVPSLALSSPTVSSQQAVTPPGQPGSVSSSQASQVVANPQGSTSLVPSSPTVSSQQAVTPPGQPGSVSSSQASQVVANPQGSASLAPSSPTVSSQQAVTSPGQPGSVSSSQASQVVANPQGTASLAPSSPTVSSQQAVTPPGQPGSVSSSQASQVVANPQGTASLAPSSPTVSSQLNPAGAAQMPAGTPGVSSSSALPSSSAGATAGTATPQSGGSTSPASVAGPAGAASQGPNPPSNSSAVTQSPQPSSVSIAPAIASTVSNPPATPTVNNASSSSAPVAAQFLISLSPSLSNVLGGAGSTAVTTSNPVSTTSAMSALSTGGTSSSTPLSGSLASSNLPLPSVEVASQTLVNPAPDATSTGFVMGILPQNIPEPRVLDMLMALVTVFALRHVCGHGVPGFWSARGSSIGQRDGDLCSKAGVGDE